MLNHTFRFVPRSCGRSVYVRAFAPEIATGAPLCGSLMYHW